MFDENIKTSFWVTAEIRRCDGLFLPVTVLYKGDSDRGIVLIKQYISRQSCYLHAQRRNLEGHIEWYRPLGETPRGETAVDDYIARQRQYDEDLWALEVDDPRGQYSPLA